VSTRQLGLGRRSAPARVWGLTREDCVELAAKWEIPITVTKDKLYSIDDNLWGKAIECGAIEDPWAPAPDDVYSLTRFGNVINQLTSNQAAPRSRWDTGANAWSFYPRLSADQRTLFMSYDGPKAAGDGNFNVVMQVWGIPLGGTFRQEFAGSSPRGWEALIRTNFTWLLHATQLALPPMRA